MHIREHQWVEVDLEAIRDNVRTFRRHTGRSVLAVVKADGYGHGAVAVSRAAVEAGACYLGVSSVSEGSLLRRSGITIPILVMGPQLGLEYEVAVNYELDCAVWTKEQFDCINTLAAASNKAIRVHLKVDIGMGRFGVFPEDVVETLRLLKRYSHLSVVGLISHLSASDENRETTIRQGQIVHELINQLEALALRPELVHISNSGAASGYPELNYDMVRVGLSLYGIAALSDASLSSSLKAALSWRCKVVSIREFPALTPISYGSEYITKAAERIAAIPVGYADGYRRIPKAVNRVLIGGMFIPVIGRVCQQFCMVNVDILPGISLGTPVTLLGRDCGAEISAGDLASTWGTNEWDVLCGISRSVERKYLN